MAARKPPKRLFRNTDVIHSYEHDRGAKTSAKHMTRDHIDVLQNIEFALVKCAREDPSIDDGLIDQALRLCRSGTDVPEDIDSRLAMLCDVLMHFRSARDDVTDQIWNAGLRTVSESVRRHSGLRPGEKGYLNFVEPYVK
jgi:hypothetical protein